MTRPLLLCTDLDRTLIPNGAAPESPSARPRLRALAALPAVTLAYVSGRHRALVRSAMDAWALPVPDYVIGDVGTSLHRITAGGWEPSARWQAVIGRDWGDQGAADFQPWLADLPGLRLQEPDKQTPFKLSFFVQPDIAVDALCTLIAGRLAARGFTASLVFSIDEALGVGLLDLLPPRAGKYQAVDFLRCELGFGADEVLFAGDSGNDLAVLVSPLPAVLVANAQDQLRELALRESAAAGTAAQLYCATGGWWDMNGHYAAGILEGVAHFRPDLIPLIDRQ